jgi:hypothetical protein
MLSIASLSMEREEEDRGEGETIPQRTSSSRYLPMK